MKRRTALIGLIGLFIIFLLINATENDDLISDGILPAKVGENVTLGCKSQLDVTDKSIEWKFKGTFIVLLYKSRGFSTEHQAKQFRGRASPDSSWNPAEGNLALKISSVEITDAGVYTCSVGTGSQQTSHSTTLNIQHSIRESNLKDGDGNADPKEEGMGPGTIAAIVIAIFAIPAIAAIIFVCFKKRPNENAKKNAKENQGTREEMNELRGGRGPEHV